MCLECRHIHYKYPGTEEGLFSDLSFDFKSPGLHAIFGPSGVGKSTLAKLITGLLTPDRGEIRTSNYGTPLYTHNTERLPDWSSIGRHLDRITPEHGRQSKSDLTALFDLTPLLKQRFSQLSLGQKNRVNLVRYLVQDSRCLIMDESLANVDEKLRSQILPGMKTLFPDTLFIYISHNLLEVARFCNSIWVLRDVHKKPGIVLVEGQDLPPDTVGDQDTLQRTMLEIMHAA